LDSKAKWIWTARPQRPGHSFVCFRRSLELKGDASQAMLKITADSRYILYVNGRWVGNGPPRAFPSPWTVDEYDLRGLLRRGRNVVSVLVQHIGLSTFQYILCDPGLLAQLDWRDGRGSHRLVSDSSWRCRPHEGYTWPVPRESVHKGWEEQFDARKGPGPDWTEADYDDSAWPAARAVCNVGQGAHRELAPRDIPMMTRQCIDPERIVSIAAVAPAPYSWSLDLKKSFNPDDHSANKNFGHLLVATFIHSSAAQKIQFHLPHRLGHAVGYWKFNGSELKFDTPSPQLGGSGLAIARCKKGWNCLMAQMAEIAHLWQDAINIWTDAPVTFSAYPKKTKDQPWLGIGPFQCDLPLETQSWKPQVRATRILPQATTERYQAIWDRGRPSEEELSSDLCRPLGKGQINPVDVYAICSSERVVAGAKARVESPAAMLHDNADWTTLYPCRGADVRLVLDFGREISGQEEFEIDAPAGTILDCQRYEYTHPDGRPELAEGTNNSFRYTCRDGLQRYSTFQRHGFRYLAITLRNMTQPVYIRFFRALMHLYPAHVRGDFSCSNPMLDRIWHIGAATVQCCMDDTYVDCPGYEQTFWVIDARLESLTDLTLTGDPRLSRHCWLLAAQSLNHSPLVESQVPSGWRNILPMSSLLWMVWAWELFEYTGDRRLGRKMLDYLDRNAEGIEMGRNKMGLFDLPGSNMLDWAPMDTPGYGTITHVNCLAVLGLKNAARLARQLGDPRRAARWEALAGELIRAANKHLWSPRRQAYIDCIHVDGRRSEVFSQQTQTVAFLAGVAQGDRRRRCRSIIDKAPKGFVRFESPGLMSLVLEALLAQGRYEDMVKTIADYWSLQVRVGASTFWETFHLTGRATRSHCHGWGATPTYFLPRYILGVGPGKPGFEEILIAPHPSGLSWANGRVPAPRGEIACRWEDAAGSFNMHVDLPEGVPVRIELPCKGEVTVTQGRLRRGPGGTVLTGYGPHLTVSVRKSPARRR
jgi:hypothetical protein